MENREDIISQIISQRQPQTKTLDKKYDKLGLKFNPFPKSGTTNINSDVHAGHLVPVDETVYKQVHDYVYDSLYSISASPKDKLLTAVIIGDYGSGKTQLLMYVRYLLDATSQSKEFYKNPYVIYIDNPGVKLSELIGAIISKIGEENFKKFIWNKIIEKIKNTKTYKERLGKLNKKSLLTENNPDPYDPVNLVSYKAFLDAWLRNIYDNRSRKEFEATFQGVLFEILKGEFNDATLAKYFYDLVSDDFGVNKTWEVISSGSGKRLDRKDIDIIRAIVTLVKEQEYTDFYILVDEFEDITEGRLSKTQVDNYVYNLRTLLDEHREWCLLFAMTGNALKKLRSVSPPLADRISNRSIFLNKLNNEQAKKIVINYLNIARVNASEDVTPFDLSGIEKINNDVDGITRIFLQKCFYLTERAVESLQQGQTINDKFVDYYLPKEIE